MSTATLTLTEFLLARIAEDEAAAYKDQPWKWTDEHSKPIPDLEEVEFYGAWSGMSMSVPVKRFLAECEAKRRIVERLGPLLDMFSREREEACGPEIERAEDVLEALALPYADHPDFRDEWRA